MHHAAPVRRCPVSRACLAVVVCLFALIGIGTARAQIPAQAPDTILVNGKLVVFDGVPAQALAVRSGKISAIGNSRDIRALAGPSTRVIDVGGRTVIPGLIDSHIHAIRAGLTYTTEVHWIGVRTLAEALERIRVAAKAAPKGAWLVVAGGWTERQFSEDRRPTQAEIAAAAPDHHVYIQQLYSRVLLDPGGADALGIAGNPELLARVIAERDNEGRPTGWLGGDNRAISDLYDLLPRPTFAQKIEGTRAFFRALNAMGITGVLDPGGYNLALADYQPLFQVWRERGLTLRVRYSLSAPRRGRELEDFKELTQALPMGLGDGWLRFNGIGENVTWGLYNNDNPGDAQKAQLYEVLRWAVSRGMTATFHWHNDRPVHHLLDVLERINADTPVAKLRWSIAHLNDASLTSLNRMKAMGLGWLMQNAFYFRGEEFLGQRGADIARAVPPIVSALRLKLPVGGGTDAHRVMVPSPFVSLQWMLDGKTISGVAMRAQGELPTRIEALRLYTQGSAWFSFEENERGALAVGQLADLAVLSRDYLSMPLDKIGSLVSLLTTVGGRIVYADGPFAAYEDKPHRAGQLKALGVAPADVTYVAFSHFHSDHMGNANLFAASTWILNQAELSWALSPAAVAVDASLFSAYKSAKTQMIDGDHDVFGDGAVRILKAPGHTPGHQVLLLKLRKSGSVMLSGDLYHLRANRQHRRVPVFNTERADTLASMDRIERIINNTKARFVVQHDPEDFKALPKFPAYLE